MMTKTNRFSENFIQVWFLNSYQKTLLAKHFYNLIACKISSLVCSGVLPSV